MLRIYNHPATLLDPATLLPSVRATTAQTAPAAEQPPAAPEGLPQPAWRDESSAESNAGWTLAAGSGPPPAEQVARNVPWLDESWPPSQRRTLNAAFSPAVSAKVSAVLLLLQHAARTDEKVGWRPQRLAGRLTARCASLTAALRPRDDVGAPLLAVSGDARHHRARAPARPLAAAEPRRRPRVATARGPPTPRVGSRLATRTRLCPSRRSDDDRSARPDGRAVQLVPPCVGPAALPHLHARRGLWAQSDGGF
eukprot:scaffold202112_cov18-Tisochrysis_lutea.AAC.1